MAYVKTVYQTDDPAKGPPPSYEPPAESLDHTYVTSGGQPEHMYLPQQHQQQQNPPQYQQQPQFQNPPQFQPQFQQHEQFPPQGVIVPQQPQGVIVPQQPQGVIVPNTQQPGQNTIYRQGQMQPNDFLAFAIIVTICCCLPLGIVAIIKSTEVRNKFVAGDYHGAEQASRAARNWSIAGLVGGLVTVVSVILFYVIIILISASSY